MFSKWAKGVGLQAPFSHLKNTGLAEIYQFAHRERDFKRQLEKSPCIPLENNDYILGNELRHGVSLEIFICNLQLLVGLFTIFWQESNVNTTCNFCFDVLCKSCAWPNRKPLEISWKRLENLADKGRVRRIRGSRCNVFFGVKTMDGLQL